jgi:LysM repeat protein
VKASFFQGICLALAIPSFSPLNAAQMVYYAAPPPMDALKNQVNNHSAELHTFQQRLENFQEILDTLHEQFYEQGKSQKQQLKKETASLEIKIASLENMAKDLSLDMKQLQAHANETAASLQVAKQKLAQGEERAEHLQAVIQTLMEALQVKLDLSPTAMNGKTYQVKSGDNLEKIARAHGKTVQAIKALNQMSSDKIIVGKTLQIPE